jgi:hypothetical protein
MCGDPGFTPDDSIEGSPADSCIDLWKGESRDATRVGRLDRTGFRISTAIESVGHRAIGSSVTTEIAIIERRMYETLF